MATSSASAAPATRSDGYKWIALSNTTLGVLLVAINESILIIALPAIFRGIKLNPLVPSNSFYLLWILLGFMLVTAVLVVTLGRIGDIYGRVRMYNLGFAVFTVFSVLLSVNWLHGSSAGLFIIIMRLGQGVGGSFLFANSSAILTDAFPEQQRGMALGINNIAGIAGAFIGLVAGGLLAPVDWRLVFIVSAPVGLIGTVWAYLKLRDNGVRTKARIDWWGNVLFAVGLTLVLIGITYGIEPYGTSSMGWTSPRVLTELSVGVAILVVFGIVESKVAMPMFRMSLFKIRAFLAGNVASLLAAIGRGGLMFLFVMWLQGIWLPLHGYSFTETPLWAGIYMLPMTAGFLVAGPISGVLSDRFGARPFATTGMAAAALTFVGFDLLPINFSYPEFALLMAANGLAMGLFASPNRAAVMNSLPPDQRGAGAGMSGVFQNAAMVLSMGIFFTLMISGIATDLPHALYAGLVAQHVPVADATAVSHLPPITSLFAALLGYDPMKSLLGARVLAALPRHSAAVLSGKRFFPTLLTKPFGDGLSIAFSFGAIACVLAGVASLLRGKRYVYSQPVAVAGASPLDIGAAAEAATGAEAATRAAPVPGALPASLAEIEARRDEARAAALHRIDPALVVTVSATYGAGGGVVAPKLAECLGLPFVDRAVPAEVAAELDVPLADALGHDERGQSVVARLFSSLPIGTMLYEPRFADGAITDAARYLAATEAILWRYAATTGAVVLGRAGAVVLAEHPRLLRVRLDGPRSVRLAAAMAPEALDEAAQSNRGAAVDAARADYARHFYGVDLSDPGLYDIVIDIGRLDADGCVAMLRAAVEHLRGTVPA
jgi:MFS family permease